jgi:NodT family efflux transporter outer membrane factor (OMF) lipoprotein
VSRRILFLILLSGLLLSSCASFAPAARQARDEVTLPAAYSIENTLETPAQRWWEKFEDSQLNALITEALSGNQSLASYWARLEKAKAQARKAGAELRPSLSGEAGASHSRRRTGDGSNSSTAENNNFFIGLSTSYEVDLWGRVKATRDAAELEAEASREDFNAAAMTVAAEIAERWVAIMSQRLQRELLEQQLSTNRIYLELVELRFRNSLASALDVLQQKQLLERIKAQMPLVDMQTRRLENQLALLLGRMPDKAPQIERQKLPALAGLPAAGLPVQLLENRPDIVAALRRLEVSDQSLAAAQADRLPALRLTGSAAYDSSELEDLFDNWLVNLGAALTAPVIDGGRRRAEVDISRAAVEQQLALYRQLVLTAVSEVENAMISEIKIRENIEALEKQLQAARNALAEARSRYINGLNDYLPVLTQLLSVQGLESDLIRRNEELLVARVSLYRAIGGSWVDDLAPPGRDN